MPRVYRSTVVDAPADEVWARIRDFGHYDRWSIAESCEIEDGKAGDQVGAVKRVQTTPNGPYIREILAAHSDVERSYTYELPEPPLPFTDYRATVRVTPITDGDRTFFEWWGTYDCSPDDAEMIGNRVAETYENGAAALKAAFSGATAR